MTFSLGDRDVLMHRRHLAGLPVLALPEDHRESCLAEHTLADWAALLDDVFGKWDLLRLQREFLDRPQWNPTRLALIEGRGGLAAASVAWEERSRWPRSGVVHWVGVREEHRGKGLGRLVVAMNLHYFAARGYRDAVLVTQDFRLPAINLYLTLGFEPLVTGTEPGERKRWEQALRALGKADQVSRIREDYASIACPPGA